MDFQSWKYVAHITLGGDPDVHFFNIFITYIFVVLYEIIEKYFRNLKLIVDGNPCYYQT